MIKQRNFSFGHSFSLSNTSDNLVCELQRLFCGKIYTRQGGLHLFTNGMQLNSNCRNCFESLGKSINPGCLGTQNRGAQRFPAFISRVISQSFPPVPC